MVILKENRKFDEAKSLHRRAVNFGMADFIKDKAISVDKHGNICRLENEVVRSDEVIAVGFGLKSRTVKFYLNQAADFNSNLGNLEMSQSLR